MVARRGLMSTPITDPAVSIKYPKPKLLPVCAIAFTLAM